MMANQGRPDTAGRMLPHPHACTLSCDAGACKEFIILYIIYQEDGPGSAALRAQHKAAHFEYLERHRDILVLGGAMLADEGDARIGSVLILNVPDRAAAEAFSANEPLRSAGVFRSVKITRMRRGQWNPAAAPATPEGN